MSVAKQAVPSPSTLLLQQPQASESPGQPGQQPANPSNEHQGYAQHASQNAEARALRFLQMAQPVDDQPWNAYVGLGLRVFAKGSGITLEVVQKVTVSQVEAPNSAAKEGPHAKSERSDGNEPDGPPSIVRKMVDNIVSMLRTCTAKINSKAPEPRKRQPSASPAASDDSKPVSSAFSADQERLAPQQGVHHAKVDDTVSELDIAESTLTPAPLGPQGPPSALQKTSEVPISAEKSLPQPQQPRHHGESSEAEMIKEEEKAATGSKTGEDAMKSENGSQDAGQCAEEQVKGTSEAAVNPSVAGRKMDRVRTV